MIDESLSRGIIAFIGQPGRLDRVSPEERVLRASPEDALDLLPRIKAILDEVGEHDPPLLGPNRRPATAPRCTSGTIILRCRTRR
jgi:hypothetical protein